MIFFSVSNSVSDSNPHSVPDSFSNSVKITGSHMLYESSFPPDSVSNYVADFVSDPVFDSVSDSVSDSFSYSVPKSISDSISMAYDDVGCGGGIVGQVSRHEKKRGRADTVRGYFFWIADISCLKHHILPKFF